MLEQRNSLSDRKTKRFRSAPSQVPRVGGAPPPSKSRAPPSGTDENFPFSFLHPLYGIQTKKIRGILLTATILISSSFRTPQGTLCDVMEGNRCFMLPWKLEFSA
ncbi:hypothetical protein NPIL_216551 [Nephila pilipes]|uniref:Uncharacterized protein n=1 Tax=Nephila pilipes TaxID=299642 RepID=A0A8X6N455_NEPPI|nr:hypothetical protein NPIL_216551 [Nephila pilipes]